MSSIFSRRISGQSLLAPGLASGLALGLAATVGCTADPAATFGESTLYAETVYDNYQEAAAGRIELELTTLESGSLIDIADISVGALLGVPDYWLRMTPRGTEITEIQREVRDLEQDEWQGEVSLHEFERLGYAVDEATYRLLAVTTRLEGTSSSHQALEVCWAADGHCIVMDPVVLQADAYLHDRTRLIAEGWAPEKNVDKAVGTTGVCALNSDSRYSGISYRYPGWWVEYKNIFGVVLVRKDMGEQKVGITCFVNGAGACVSSGFGYSNTSSCFANLGYSCDCENTGNLIGTSPDGAATKAWSETKCTHRALATASVAFDIEGTGANFNVQWDTAGSVDANGGQVFDSCSFH